VLAAERVEKESANTPAYPERVRREGIIEVGGELGERGLTDASTPTVF